MVGNHRGVAQMNDEREIAVIPYLAYDALMERFERSQKNLRLSMVACLLIAIGFVLSLFVGMGTTNGYSKDT